MQRFKKWFKALSSGAKAGVILAAFVGVGVVGAAAQTPSNSPPHVNTPSVTTKTVTSTKPIPFKTTTTQDATLAQGTTKVTTQGVNGVETITAQITYTNGYESAYKRVSDVYTTQPVTQVTSVGTYVAPPPTQPSCTPLTNGGNCYEPGEYCRNSDRGTSGVAGDGKSITCEDNNGWRWEPQ